MILHRMVPSDSAKSVLIDLSFPSGPKQRVLAPLQDAGGAAGCRRPGPEDGTQDAAGIQVLSAAEVAPLGYYTRDGLGLKGVQLFA